MKNTIKKLALGAVALAAISPILGFAQPLDPFQKNEPKLPQQLLDYGGVIGLFERVAGIIFGILVAVAVILIIVAAYNYLWSKKIDDAKAQIIAAAAAIAIALLARGLPYLVQSLVGNV